MAVPTGSDGAFTYENVAVGRCKGWTLNVQRDKVDITPLGVYDREYLQTLRGVTGTAIVLYDPTIIQHSNLFNRILSDSREVTGIGFVFYTDLNGVIDTDCVIDSMSVPMNTGEAMATTFNFTIQGKARGSF